MPRGSNIPEPLLFDIGGYMSWVPLFSVAIAIGMRKAKQRWPKIGTLELLGVALVMGMIMDLVLEGAFVLTGLYRFTGAVYSWSIWGGEQYQFPVYEAILWGAVWAAGAALWYFKDDKGHMWVERGCENIRSATTSVFLRLMVNRPRIPGHRLSLRHLA
jgi:hypothetical protein